LSLKALASYQLLIRGVTDKRKPARRETEFWDCYPQTNRCKKGKGKMEGEKLGSIHKQREK